MSANEIAERSAAAAWVACSPDFSSLLYRSSVGFLDVVLASADLDTYPLLVLQLDREMARIEFQSFARAVTTVGDDGASHPSALRRVFIEPMRLAWLGDPSAPSWRPFEGTPTPLDGLDTYDAIAVLLPDGATDFTVHVLKSPYYEGAAVVEPVIPAPEPPPTLFKVWRYRSTELGEPVPDTVATWPDLEANPLNATQAVPEEQPFVEPQGFPLLDFHQSVTATDGPAQSVTATFFDGPTPGAVSISGVAIADTRGEFDSDAGYVICLGPDDFGVRYEHNEGNPRWVLVVNGTAYAIASDAADGSVLAFACRIEADGTFYVERSYNWEPTDIAFGAAGAGPAALTTLTLGNPGDDASLRWGEAAAWNRALSDGEIAAELDALRARWEPYPAMRWFAPDLSPGEVPTWIDESAQAVALSNGFGPLRPDAAVGLNGLLTLQGDSSKPLIGSFDPCTGKPAQISFVLLAPAGSDNSLVYLYNENDATEMFLQYYSATEELFLNLYTDDGAESILLGGPGVYAGSAWWNPATGEYYATISKEWAPAVVLSGAFTNLAVPEWSNFTVNAAIPEVSTVIAELGEVRVAFPAQPAQQESILAELRATWEPVALLNLLSPSVPRRCVPALWPQATMTSGQWKTTVVPTNDSAEPAEQVLYSMQPANEGRISLEGGALKIFETFGGEAGSFPLTYSAGQALTFQFDIAAGSVAVSGATTGNGVHTWTPFVWGSLGELTYQGKIDSGTPQDAFAGVLQDVLDPSDDSVIFEPSKPAYSIYGGNTWWPETLMTSGKWAIEFTPNFDSGTVDGRMNLVTLQDFSLLETDSDSGLGVTNLRVLSEDGATQAELPIEFSAGQKLRVTLDLSVNPRTCTIERASAGNGSFNIGSAWVWTSAGVLNVGGFDPGRPWPGTITGIFSA